MKQPKLTEVPVPEITPGGAYITMDPGQWDALLAAAYEARWFLLEVDRDVVVKAYRKSAKDDA